MASFDIIKLELSPYADVTDAKSVAGSLWQTTLQYVFRQVSEFAAPAVADARVLWGHSQTSKHVIFLFIGKLSLPLSSVLPARWASRACSLIRCPCCLQLGRIASRAIGFITRASAQT